MSFQLTFLGYYSIKSPQLKKQTHSVKRRNWSHRERTAQADGPRWTVEADGFRWTAIADSPRRTGQPSASVGRPWRTAPAAGGRPRHPPADSRQSRRPWDRRTRPDVRTRDNPAIGLRDSELLLLAEAILKNEASVKSNKIAGQRETIMLNDWCMMRKYDRVIKNELMLEFRGKPLPSKKTGF
jgi:hypothetical protein